MLSHDDEANINTPTIKQIMIRKQNAIAYALVVATGLTSQLSLAQQIPLTDSQMLLNMIQRGVGDSSKMTREERARFGHMFGGAASQDQAEAQKRAEAQANERARSKAEAEKSADIDVDAIVKSSLEKMTPTELEKFKQIFNGLK